MQTNNRWEPVCARLHYRISDPHYVLRGGDYHLHLQINGQAQRDEETHQNFTACSWLHWYLDPTCLSRVSPTRMWKLWGPHAVYGVLPDACPPRLGHTCTPAHPSGGSHSFPRCLSSTIYLLVLHGVHIVSLWVWDTSDDKVCTPQARPHLSQSAWQSPDVLSPGECAPNKLALGLTVAPLLLQPLEQPRGSGVLAATKLQHFKSEFLKESFGSSFELGSLRDVQWRWSKLWEKLSQKL